jgi:two-component system chemotaxis sensor kinase CheA
MAQDPYRYFRPEAREILDQFSRGVLDLEKGSTAAATIPRLLRLAHTLKGAARVVKQPEIANRAHAIEDALSPLREATDGVGRATIDVLIQHLDAIQSRLTLLDRRPEPAAPVAGMPAVAEPPRTVRTDLAEADAVLDGVVEAHSLMSGLRSAARDIGKLTQLADLLTPQSLSNAADRSERRADTRANRRSALGEELRRKLGTIERSLGTAVDQMDRELRQLREAAERLRLARAETLFTALERTASDIARTLSKQVTFQATGGDIRLDAQVLDTLQGALVQIVRNAVAHGIETSEARTKAGKPAAGRVAVAIARRQRRIVFSCSDDGRGIDLEAVRKAAVGRGATGGAAGHALGADELVGILLRGGISTSKTVTEASGRGIGLDVVREAVNRLGGELECRSIPFAGTTFEIVIPPSLSSLDALFVEAGEGCGPIAIPLDAVRGTRRLTAGEITRTASNASVLHDEKAIPFLPLASALEGRSWPADRDWSAAIVAGADGFAAIGVERLLGTAKAVVRPLPKHMAASPIVVAASLDADGNPQLVLDPDGLVVAARSGRVDERNAAQAKRCVLVVDDSLTTRMLEQSILEAAGYDVDLAVSGEEALDRVRDKTYALILADVEMPGMDGFTLVERIRASAKSRDIPAILVTSLAEPEHRQRGRDVGAQGYIVKSEFDQAALLSMIEPMMAA